MCCADFLRDSVLLKDHYFLLSALKFDQKTGQNLVTLERGIFPESDFGPVILIATGIRTTRLSTRRIPLSHYTQFL
jgi:hypothetical protein